MREDSFILSCRSSILIFLLIVFSIPALSLESNSLIDKRVVITNLYPDTPQYTSDYFFVGSYLDNNHPQINNIVKSRTLLKFNINDFKNKEILKAELVLIADLQNPKTNPDKLSVIEAYSVNKDWNGATWNNAQDIENQKIGEIEVTESRVYSSIDITSEFKSLFINNYGILLKSENEAEDNIKQFTLNSYIKITYNYESVYGREGSDKDTEVICQCPDVNNDGAVNISDLYETAQHTYEGEDENNIKYNLDSSNDMIDENDLNCIKSNLGKSISDIEDLCHPDNARNQFAQSAPSNIGVTGKQQTKTTTQSSTTSTIPYGTNLKNKEMYSDKQVFLVSDKNWKEVLPWVSAVIWEPTKTLDEKLGGDAITPGRWSAEKGTIIGGSREQIIFDGTPAEIKTLGIYSKIPTQFTYKIFIDLVEYNSDGKENKRYNFGAYQKMDQSNPYKGWITLNRNSPVRINTAKYTYWLHVYMEDVRNINNIAEWMFVYTGKSPDELFRLDETEFEKELSDFISKTEKDLIDLNICDKSGTKINWRDALSALKKGGSIALSFASHGSFSIDYRSNNGDSNLDLDCDLVMKARIADFVEQKIEQKRLEGSLGEEIKTEYKGYTYQVLDDENEKIAVNFQDETESDKDWCNTLRFDDERVYPKPVEKCAYPLLIWHEEDFDKTSNIMQLDIPESAKEVKISGNKIAYIQDKEIYVYNLIDKNIQKLTDSLTDKYDLNFQNNMLVWGDTRTGNDDIYLYNLATETEVRITENNYDQIKPVITDNYIVWSDNRNKDFDIYLYNVLTREEIQITDTRLQNEFNPKVSNKGIIWHTGTGDNLYFYNFQTKETTNLGIGFPSYISDNFIVWVKDNHLNIKDLSSNINQLIVIGKDSGSSGLGNLRLFNDKIIYTNTVNGKYSLYLRDLRNYDEKIIVDNPSFGFDTGPDISDEKITFKLEYGGPWFMYSESGFKYHQNGFDADSVIYFMQQYKSNNAIILGDIPQEIKNLIEALPEVGVGISHENIKQKRVSDYFSYWKKFDKIVYVKDDYELALLASTYASLINAPLIIENSELDSENVVKNRKVICVGSVSPKSGICAEKYDIEQLQRKFKEMTKTNKVILVNPADLDIYVDERFKPDKSSKMEKIYSGASLASPILAAAKNELILPIKSTDYEETNSIFKKRINDYFDIEFKSQTCNGGDACSSGFIRMDKEFYIKEKEISYRINEDIDINEIKKNNPYTLNDYITFQFPAIIECSSDNVNVDLYNNGNLIASEKFPCKNDVFVDGIYTNIFRGITEIKKGYLTLKAEDGKFAFDKIESSVKLILSYPEFSAEYINPASLQKTTRTKMVAKGTTTFNFNLEKNKETYVLIDIDGLNSFATEYTQLYDYDIYVNEVLIKKAIMFNYLKNYRINIPEDLVSTGVASVKLVPLNRDLQEDNELRYGVKVSIVQNLHPIYLTIMGNPNAIEYKRYAQNRMMPLLSESESVDQRMYADIDGDKLPDFSLGRIMGITLSDVSGYISRAIWYNTFEKTNNMEFMASKTNGQFENIENHRIMESEFSKAGYTTSGEKDFHDNEDEYVGTKSMWEGKELISYGDHGSSGWLGINSGELPLLSNSLIFADGCSSCSTWDSKSFCNNAIRKGATSYVGNVDFSYGGDNTHIKTIDGVYSQNLAIGDAFRLSYSPNENRRMVTLIGDPTLIINPTYRLKPLNTEMKIESINEFNVELKGEFTPEEKQDIKEVLRLYESTIGDLKNYNFALKKGEFEKGKYESDGKVDGYYTPLSGYKNRAQTDINTGEIEITPMDVINRHYIWLKDKDKLPGEGVMVTAGDRTYIIKPEMDTWKYEFIAEGEEGKIYDYKWTLAHELAHAISVKEGFMNNLLFINMEGISDSDMLNFVDTFIQLSDEIENNCPDSLENYQNNKRPECFVSVYSYNNLAEDFAETTAYILLNADYADNDKWVTKKVDLVKTEINRIKQKNQNEKQ